jgi:hypothetical protein
LVPTVAAKDLARTNVVDVVLLEEVVPDPAVVERAGVLVR